MKFNENVYKVLQIETSTFPHLQFSKQYLYIHQRKLLVFGRLLSLTI